MATLPGALLLCLSSPYSRKGALWNAYDQHYGVDGDPVLVFQGDTQTLNPSIAQNIIDDAYEADASAASAEYGAQFRSDIEAFLDPAWITSAVPEGVHELAPIQGTSYVGFTDPSGGSHDSFTLGIAHAEGKRLILDVLRSRKPPFDLKAVVAEYALTLKRFGLTQVTGDRYGGDWPSTEFLAQGIYYQPSERIKSDIYLEILPHFSTGAIQLLDNRTLTTQLAQLERRTGAGRDRVDHPPRGADDSANAACGALLLAVRGTMTAEEFQKGSMAVSMSESRDARDSHLADLGLTSVAEDRAYFESDRDNPWTILKEIE